MESRPALPRTVLALGFVSLAMDLSSEIIHALLPLFMVGTLGLSVAMVGLIDGVAEATASITKVFSGWISDRLGRRKPLILLVAAVVLALVALHQVAVRRQVVAGARGFERVRDPAEELLDLLLVRPRRRRTTRRLRGRGAQRERERCQQSGDREREQ